MRSRRSDTGTALPAVQRRCGRSQARADGRGGDPGQMWRGDSCSTRCPDARVANAIGPGTHESEPSRAGDVRHVKASAQEEEPSFWIMAAVCEKLYCGIFSETLWGAAGLLPVGH